MVQPSVRVTASRVSGSPGSSVAPELEGCFLDLALGGSLQPGLASNPARFGPEVRKYARLGEAEGLAHVGARNSACQGLKSRRLKRGGVVSSVCGVAKPVAASDIVATRRF